MRAIASARSTGLSKGPMLKVFELSAMTKLMMITQQSY